MPPDFSILTERLTPVILCFLPFPLLLQLRSRAAAYVSLLLLFHLKAKLTWLPQDDTHSYYSSLSNNQKEISNIRTQLIDQIEYNFNHKYLQYLFTTFRSWYPQKTNLKTYFSRLNCTFLRVRVRVRAVTCFTSTVFIAENLVDCVNVIQLIARFCQI